MGPDGRKSSCDGTAWPEILLLVALAGGITALVVLTIKALS